MPFLPVGTAVMPAYLDIRRGTQTEFAEAIPRYECLVGLLAERRCEVVAAVGAPPFMTLTRAREAALIADWERRYRVPIFTAPQNQAHALRALGAKRIVGVTYFGASQNTLFGQYFTDAGIEVLSIDGIERSFETVHHIAGAELAALIRASVGRHRDAEAIYILGSAWRVIDIVDDLERELGIPVVHPVTALAWELQQHLGLHFPVRGYGKLLAELPSLIR